VREGWQTKTLADACQIRPPKSEARERLGADALVSFVPMEDLGVDRKSVNATQVKPLASVIGSYTYFADGDVLLAKITPCFENGKLGIAEGLSNGVGFGSSEFMVLRACSGLDKDYLYYYLSQPSFRSEGAARMGGAVGQQRVSKEFIESHPIPLPPLPEQQRIAGILDEAFEGIAIAKANREEPPQRPSPLRELPRVCLQSAPRGMGGDDFGRGGGPSCRLRLQERRIHSVEQERPAPQGRQHHSGLAPLGGPQAMAHITDGWI
jgi:hypothetical protein